MTEDVVFADDHDTKIVMEMSGNSTSGREIGLVMPRDYLQGWFVVFEYQGLGYIEMTRQRHLTLKPYLKA